MLARPGAGRHGTRRVGAGVGAHVLVILLHAHTLCSELRVRLGELTAKDVVVVCRDGDTREDRNDRHDYHHLQQRESLLRIHRNGSFTLRVVTDINKENPVLAKIADQWSPGNDERASRPPTGSWAVMNGVMADRACPRARSP